MELCPREVVAIILGGVSLADICCMMFVSRYFGWIRASVRAGVDRMNVPQMLYFYGLYGTNILDACWDERKYTDLCRRVYIPMDYAIVNINPHRTHGMLEAMILAIPTADRFACLRLAIEPYVGDVIYLSYINRVHKITASITDIKFGDLDIPKETGLTADLYGRLRVFNPIIHESNTYANLLVLANLIPDKDALIQHAMLLAHEYDFPVKHRGTLAVAFKIAKASHSARYTNGLSKILLKADNARGLLIFLPHNAMVYYMRNVYKVPNKTLRKLSGLQVWQLKTVAICGIRKNLKFNAAAFTVAIDQHLQS